MKALHAIAFALVAIGAINWGLVGLGSFFGGNWNLVEWLVASWSEVIADIVYVLVGLSGVYLIFTHKSDCRHCEGKSTGQAPM